MLNKPLQNFVGGKIKIDLYEGETIEVELQELLGVGSLGRVWKTQDLSSGELYILKIVNNFDPDTTLAKRFRLEAEVAIPSEYIICSVGFREWDDRTYLILFEYFAGVSLKDYLARHHLDIEQKRKIFQQILTAVGDAHRCNVIHRDLKPANVLVVPNESLGELLKIVDFGIAKLLNESGAVSVTQAYVGTLAYSSLEQLEGLPLDPRSDIYSLGIMLYQMLVGVLPIIPTSDSFAGWYQAHRKKR
ncbi:MAG: serine/threonine protein kinase, partial [Prochloraceae cyanobacterium]